MRSTFDEQKKIVEKLIYDAANDGFYFTNLPRHLSNKEILSWLDDMGFDTTINYDDKTCNVTWC